MSDLKDKVVLVVGGGTGIGLGIGEAFAREGAQVVLAGRTQASLDAAKALPEVGDRFLIKTADAVDRQSVADLVSWTEEQCGAIDILVFSAGTNVPKRSFADLDPNEFDQVMNVNATGAFNCIHAVLADMRKRGAGLIINVISVAGLRNLQLAGLAYCASKFAQSSIGRFANLEALEDGVAVTNLYPGETNTPILDKRPVVPPAEKRAKMVHPEDIGAMAVAVAKLPARATVPEIVVTPRHMPIN